MIEQWMSILTKSGYNLVAVKGWTLRNEDGDYPSQTLNCHYQHHKSRRDLVLCHYNVMNTDRWTTYATLFSGKAANLYADFKVKGTKMTEIDNLGALEPALMLGGDR